MRIGSAQDLDSAWSSLVRRRAVREPQIFCV
jgi:hypothetical protein